MSHCDETLAFGGNRIDVQYSTDYPELSRTNLARYNFAIACRVLEQVDSFLSAVENMLFITRAGGVVYIVLPDIKNRAKLRFCSPSRRVPRTTMHADLHDCGIAGEEG